MGKRMDFNNKLNNICSAIASIDYVDLQNEFRNEFDSEKTIFPQ